MHFEPRLPEQWAQCKVAYRYRETVYHITLLKKGGTWTGPQKIAIDGVPCATPTIHLVDDRQEYSVEVQF